MALEKKHFRVVNDFPKKGIEFIDITPVLANTNKLCELIKEVKYDICNTFENIHFNKVVVAESRGFILGASIASSYCCGLVLARKVGKHPTEVVYTKYGTEYNEQIITLQVNDISAGDKVLIHDDILATGGTILAIKKLVEMLGGEVVGYSFIGEIAECKGREAIGDDDKISCLFSF